MAAALELPSQPIPGSDETFCPERHPLTANMIARVTKEHCGFRITAASRLYETNKRVRGRWCAVRTSILQAGGIIETEAFSVNGSQAEKGATPSGQLAFAPHPARQGQMMDAWKRLKVNRVRLESYDRGVVLGSGGRIGTTVAG